MGKFNAFFQVRRNMIFERARFNRQNQLLSKTTEQYIMALNTLAANCNYSALEAKMICDRLVVGIRDTSLSLPPTTGPRPDVGESKKGHTSARSCIWTAKHTQRNWHPSLEAVHSYGRRRRTHDHRCDQQHRRNRSFNAGTGKSQQKPTVKQCTRYGKEQHARNKCPAKDATCHKCRKKGHYSTQCFAVQCEIDLSYRAMPTKQLSWWLNWSQTCQALNLAVTLDKTADTTPLTAPSIHKQFPKVFQGLGNLGEEYEIKLKPDATPFSLFHTTSGTTATEEKGHRRARANGDDGSDLESRRLHSLVCWHGGGPKKVWCCANLCGFKTTKPECPARSPPPPKSGWQLAGAKLLSKLDTNSGFWQIPLSPASCLLTTFITPSAWYCFNS